MDGVDALIQASLLGEAVDNGHAAVFVVCDDRKFIAVNRAACTLVGYSREAILELRTHDLAEPSPRWDELRRGPITGTTQLRRRDGSIVAYAYVAGPTVVAGMPVYISVGAG